MRTAIYARVSTVGNGQSPEMQLRELEPAVFLIIDDNR
jgi:hypothetical protein